MSNGTDEPPLRVTTIELFFDLVFAFTLTQLGTLLASGFTAADAVRVLLIFGLLWWMYEGYAWLTNARPPVHPAERVLLLVGMAGFLTIELAIPDGFGGSSLALGLGYLAVVIVHAVLRCSWWRRPCSAWPWPPRCGGSCSAAATRRRPSRS